MKSNVLRLILVLTAFAIVPDIWALDGAPPAAAAVALAQDPIAPDGITYLTATAAENQAAHDKLQAAFSGEKLDLLDLISEGVDKNQKVLLGVYLSQIVAKDPAYSEGALADGKYDLPLSKKDGILVNALLLFADTRPRAKTAADLISGIYRPEKPFMIRKLTKDEMSLIWFYISWDLVEPIYVVEDGGHKLVFEFDPTGTSLTWIEDITEPCFSLKVGNSCLPCMCHVIQHEGNRYGGGFRPMSECAAARHE